MVDPSLTPSFLVAAAVGAAAGFVFFGGLWWTVQRLAEARRPLGLYFGSLTVRSLLAVAAFLAVLRLYDWPQLVAALVAFVAVRLVFVRRLGRAASLDEAARKVS